MPHVSLQRDLAQDGVSKFHPWGTGVLSPVSTKLEPMMLFSAPKDILSNVSPEHPASMASNMDLRNNCVSYPGKLYRTEQSKTSFSTSDLPSRQLSSNRAARHKKSLTLRKARLVPSDDFNHYVTVSYSDLSDLRMLPIPPPYLASVSPGNAQVNKAICTFEL